MTQIHVTTVCERRGSQTFGDCTNILPGCLQLPFKVINIDSIKLRSPACLILWGQQHIRVDGQQNHQAETKNVYHLKQVLTV